MALMISISGIRGVVGESLTPEVAVRYAAAFAEFCRRGNGPHPEIVLGRDGRATGAIFANVISSTLLASGARVRALGVCPTPTVQLAVERIGAAGGIAVTASHNPMQWNGMKFVAASGMFLDADENRTFWSLAENRPSYSSWDALGTHVADTTWLRRHIDEVLALPYVNVETIKKRRFKVVLDCVNAAGGAIVPEMLQALGCSVVKMHCDSTGIFPHAPEPIPENLTELAGRVRQENADLGIAVDPDVDRLVLITEKGEPYSEEYTIATAVNFVLGRRLKDQKGLAGTPVDRPKVVINLSTTRAVEDIGRKFGTDVIRTPVGEINVAKKMKAVGALIGGEGSGGVILPAIHLGRDAIVGIGLILQALAEFNGPLSALKESLPQYSIAKGKIPLGTAPPAAILARIREAHSADGTVNTDDGLRIDTPRYWVHLRPSNTEPILRIIAEAPSIQEASSIVDRYAAEVRAIASRAAS